MKQTVVLILLCLFLLSGCQGEEVPEQKAGLSFSYQNVEITMDAAAEPIIDALGEPKSYTEETSCAFTGLDKTYFYGSFYLTTCPTDSGDRIYSAWFVDDNITTAEGIRIGSSKDAVADAYPDGKWSGTSTCIVTLDDSRLTIIFRDRLVSSIQYEVILY